MDACVLYSLRSKETLPAINSVQYILQNQPMPLEQQVHIKQLGRPTPDLKIKTASVCNGRTYNRKFNNTIYIKNEWICGCPVINKLFCFICLLCQKISVWTKDGVSDLKHMSAKMKKHVTSSKHLHACIDFSVLGKIKIDKQLDDTYLRNKIKYRDQVERNQLILRRLITSFRFCGASDVVLVKNSSDKQGFSNFAAELDAVLTLHVKDGTVFKGNSKMMQNALLDAMFTVYRSELIKQIKAASFIAVEADETTDAANHRRMVMIVRYIKNAEICERFWSFVESAGRTSAELAKAISAELQHVLSPSDNLKLIAQSYDGTSIMTGKNNGVQAIIRQMFPCAHFVHSYAHEFDLIIAETAQYHKKVKIFFATLQAFANFFTQSVKHSSVLHEIMNRLPQSIPTHWNIKSQTVNMLFEYKNCFVECLEKIIDASGVETKTLGAACGLLNNLNSPEFLFWLKIFHLIMPHVEMFFIQTASGNESLLEKAIEQLEGQIMRIKSLIDHLGSAEEPPEKRQKTICNDSNNVVAKDVCDNILVQIKERFDFKGHYSAANLLNSKRFKSYAEVFPQKYFNETVKSYPMLDGLKLKSELSAIYEWDNMCKLEGVLALLLFLADTNLKTILSEIYKLVDIVCTTPMATSEPGRCFTTLKQVKTFLKSTTCEDGLNALAVLSVEKTFIQSIPDFDNKVIESFCSKKNSRIHFICQ